MFQKWCRYIVVRRKLYLDYTEYLGPMVSNPLEAAKDAQALYGKEGHVLSWVPISQATQLMKVMLNKGIV